MFMGVGGRERERRGPKVLALGPVVNVNVFVS